MRFKVEYLGRNACVCEQADAVASDDLLDAREMARERFADAREDHGAIAFHIRDSNDAGRVVWIETFD